MKQIQKVLRLHRANRTTIFIESHMYAPIHTRVYMYIGSTQRSCRQAITTAQSMRFFLPIVAAMLSPTQPSTYTIPTPLEFDNHVGEKSTSTDWSCISDTHRIDCFQVYFDADRRSLVPIPCSIFLLSPL